MRHTYSMSFPGATTYVYYGYIISLHREESQGALHNQELDNKFVLPSVFHS